MAWQRTEAPPLFTPFQIMVLMAVLTGVKGQDGKCVVFPYNDALAELLFPHEAKKARVARVRKILDSSSMFERLRTAFVGDIALLSSKEDRMFMRMLKQRYSGWKEAEGVILEFMLGSGLVPYQEIRVPEEVLESQQKVESTKEERPIPSSNWASMGGAQERPAKRILPPSVSQTAIVNPVFHYVSFVPPRGTCVIEKHQWRAINTLPGYVLVQCGICGATGDISGPEAEKKWTQLQEAMREKNNKAA